MKSKTTTLSSDAMLQLYINSFLFIVAVFLIVDLVSSFLGVYYLTPPKVPLVFRIVIGISLSVFAIVSNACGKVIREVCHESLKVIVDKKEVEVCSRFVYYCTIFLPPFLAIFDWASAFLGITLLYSGLTVSGIEDLQALVVWFKSQFHENILVAILIIVNTICTSSSPYLLLRLAEIKNRIRFKSSVPEVPNPPEIPMGFPLESLVKDAFQNEDDDEEEAA